jgi:hypothetical protein
MATPTLLTDFTPLLASGQAVRSDAVHIVSHEQPTVTGQWVVADGYWGAQDGRLLFAAGGQQAPVIALPLGVAGRYAIYLRVLGKRPATWTTGFGVHVRLAGQATFTPLVTERNEPVFEDLYFTTADLTPESQLELGNFNLSTYLTAVLLVPAEAEPGPRAGKVIGILDFADDVPLAQPRHLAAANAVQRHADLGFDLVMWKTGNATICEYPTKIGRVRDDDNPVVGLMAEYDIMRQAVDGAKAAGIGIYGWSRLMRDPNQREGVPPPTPFHAAHPDMVQCDKDGRPSWRLSFAYPAARRYMIDVLLEVAAYGMDGIFVDLLRHPPVARYDLPLVEAWRERTGVDPRTLPGDGPEEWLRFRAEPFTQFLRELRAALAAQQGGACPLLVRTMDQPWRNLQAGADVDAWLAEGLLDGLILAPHCPSGDDYPESLDLTPFVGGPTPIYGQIWRNSSAMLAEALAAQAYGQGAAGVCLYESNVAVMRTSLRERMWRFGRPAACRAPR